MKNGHLPPGFNQWSLVDEDGWTFADIILKKALK